MSTKKEIKTKYKKLAKKYHTDKGGNEEKMQLLNWAYGVLDDYIENYKYSFSEDEILRQYPDDILKKFKV